MNSNRHILEPYNGTKTRHTCPSCGKHNEFARYIDTDTKQYVEETVGRCNREDKCGYHFTPSQFFSDNGFTKPKKQVTAFKAKFTITPASFIDFSVFGESLSNYTHNNFVIYLQRLFDTKIANRLIERYYIGTSDRWEGATIFWQIDSKGQIRSGKIMHYAPNSGRRIKDPLPDGSKKSRIYWVHSQLKRQNQFNHFTLKQCFFGEHQLTRLPNTIPVAIVESEKTAVISSIYLPEFIWLACGSLSNLTIEKCKVLGGRKVVLFPDLNGFEKWHATAQQLRAHLSLNVTVSDLLEKKATAAERQEGFDLADYLIRFDFQNIYWQDEDRKYLFEERAAIMEFEGNLPRPTAEQLAWRQMYNFG